MSADPKELYSLLIPLRAERLLVPRMCVAEVIAFADAARSRDDAAPLPVQPGLPMTAGMASDTGVPR